MERFEGQVSETIERARSLARCNAPPPTTHNCRLAAAGRPVHNQDGVGLGQVKEFVPKMENAGGWMRKHDDGKVERDACTRALLAPQPLTCASVSPYRGHYALVASPALM